MPTDAKLGLMIGVALVLLLAIVFFRRDMVTANPAVDAPMPSAPASDAPPGGYAPAPETDYAPPASDVPGDGVPYTPPADPGPYAPPPNAGPYPPSSDPLQP
jgi:hypothetical protein